MLKDEKFAVVLRIVHGSFSMLQYYPSIPFLGISCRMEKGSTSNFYYSVSLRPFSDMTITEEAEVVGVVGVAAGEVIFTSTGQFFSQSRQL